jgi:hypothetical protein
LGRTPTSPGVTVPSPTTTGRCPLSSTGHSTPQALSPMPGCPLVRVRGFGHMGPFSLSASWCRHLVGTLGRIAAISLRIESTFNGN